ncbi:MAG: antibiotic acetyltransferase, partial [Proteobacteria bacterium]|nr:antibiotic acetyltransferase [Pseudomonadota bacterium]
MALFNSYRESIIIKDHVKSKHIIAGDHSYYSGYYHGKPFEECVMYLDEVDNSADPENIDQLIIGKFCSIATGAKFMMCGIQGHNYNWIAAHPLHGFDDSFFPGHQWKGNT